MENIINLSVGEIAICSHKETIRTVGIGSCIVVGLYCKKLRIGGLLHAMLPQAPPEEKLANSGRPQKIAEEENACGCKYFGKYVDNGLNALVKLLEDAGAKREDLKAKMTGGATMLRFFGNGGSIGERNTLEARKQLQLLRIPIEGEEVGGNIGRMAELNVANGILNVTTKM